MARIDRIFKEETKKADLHPKRITKWIHYSKLHENKAQYKNGNTPEERARVHEKVEALADLIELDGEVLQDLLVRKADTDEYEIIAGHTRRDACKLLVEERHMERFALLPCIVKDISDVRAEFQLFSSNGYGKKTDYEIMCELEGMKHLIETYPEEFPDLQCGRMVERLAKQMNMKKTTVGEYQTISNNLGDKAMDEFRTGTLKKSAAVELAALPRQEQEELLDQGKTSYKDIKEHKQQQRYVLEEERGEKEEEYHDAQWFVTEYCENNSSHLQQFVKLCNQNSKNDIRGKKIQEFIAPCGLHSQNFPLELYTTFLSWGKGVEFEKGKQKLHLSYIEFVKSLESIYGPWEVKTPVLDEIDLQVTQEPMTQAKEVAVTLEPVEPEQKDGERIEDVPDFGTKVDGIETELQINRFEFPDMRNMEQREEFVLAYRSWPIWTSNLLTEETYYRFDLPDGSAIVVREYPYTSYWRKGEERGIDLFLIKQDHKHFRDAVSNMTSIKEHLKDIRKDNQL